MLINLSLALALTGSVLLATLSSTPDPLEKAFVKPNQTNTQLYVRNHRDFHLYNRFMVCSSCIPTELSRSFPTDNCGCVTSYLS
jgi:hypothetical protein